MLRRSLRLAIAALAGVLTLGTCGYMVIEGWDFLDSLWMVSITLTTIGFGEIHPLSPAGRVFTLLLIVAGVSIGTWTMTALTQSVLEGELGEWLRTQRRNRMLEKLSGHCIVAGYGRLGRTVVDELQAAHVPVAVIEKDPKLIRELEAAGIPTVAGDASEDANLKAAGIEKARSYAIAVSSSAEAIYATMSARQLNPSLNIVTRVSDPGHAIKAIRAGATAVVNPHTMGGWRMAQGLLRPHASTFLDVATLADFQDIQLEEIQVGPKHAGARLDSLNIGRAFGVLVAAMRRPNGDLLAIPDGSEKLEPGDYLITIGKPSSIRALTERCKG